eukprot:2059130-Rhodomonas_salina.1
MEAEEAFYEGCLWLLVDWLGGYSLSSYPYKIVGHTNKVSGNSYHSHQSVPISEILGYKLSSWPVDLYLRSSLQFVPETVESGTKLRVQQLTLPTTSARRSTSATTTGTR